MYDYDTVIIIIVRYKQKKGAHYMNNNIVARFVKKMEKTKDQTKRVAIAKKMAKALKKVEKPSWFELQATKARLAKVS